MPSYRHLFWPVSVWVDIRATIIFQSVATVTTCHVSFFFFLSINLSQNLLLARDGNGKINKGCWAICLTQKIRTRGCRNSLCRSKRADNGNSEIAPARLCTVSVMYGRCNLVNICCFYYQVKFWLRSAMSSFKFCETNWSRRTKQMCSALCGRAFKDCLIKQSDGWNELIAIWK